MLIETIAMVKMMVTVALTDVSAAHRYINGYGTVLVTVCEYRIDPKLNYTQSWYPWVIEIPYGHSCPRTKRVVTYINKK